MSDTPDPLALLTPGTIPSHRADSSLDSGADYYIDERDAPKGYAGDDLPDGSGSTMHGTAPARGALRIMAPLRTMPAPGIVPAAGTEAVTLAANVNTPVRIGLDPDRLRATQVASLHVTATVAVLLAGDPSSLPSRRYTLAAGQSLRLDHVSGLYVWASAADSVVSWLVVAVPS
jgi:hypothetical protein